MQKTNSHQQEFPTNKYNDRYTSIIRTLKIYLPVKTQKMDEEDDYSDYVGRKDMKECLSKWLSEGKEGSYLITGFRGMGKTSMVKQVISELVDAEPKVARKGGNFRILFSIFVLIVLCGSGIIMCLAPKDLIPCIKNHFGEYLPIVLITIILPLIIIIVFYVVIKRMQGKKNCGDEDDKCKTQKRKCGMQDKKNNGLPLNINLGHEVLKERDILSLIAVNVRDKYKSFVENSLIHFWMQLTEILLCLIVTIILSFQCVAFTKNIPGEKKVVTYGMYYNDAANNINGSYFVNAQVSDSWFSRIMWNVLVFMHDNLFISVYALELTIFFILWRLKKSILNCFVPWKTLRRLDNLNERIISTTDEESGGGTSIDKNVLTITLFNQRKKRFTPIADVREIETELANIINSINDLRLYRAQFFIIFDEMDKIDPSMTDIGNNMTLPEFTDGVKGFPGGLDSRERRHNVLRLLANIKLFITTAKAKFVFISGRELYDAYLADLSDREFAISSIFSGVMNVDSFLTPERGQTDVRSMTELYIANRLIPPSWLKKKKQENEERTGVFKKEYPSFRWYYEYLLFDGLEEKKKSTKDQREHEAEYVIGFLHTFAAYLTHISNGSPKKIFLYFDKYLRKCSSEEPHTDWGDIIEIGKPEIDKEKQLMLYFNPIDQQKINFVYFLANPIMGTITNDLSHYGDRYLISLSFIIDHIYKHHNRGFSWRNLEQIPEFLKTNKAPELRDAVASTMEFLTQIHISPILIGLNEYKFRKSIAEEISMMSKISDEASAVFNFTLDESLSVIQHNTKMLNYYMELARKDAGSEGLSTRYLPIIARIHSNLGDLHYWDEDYYSAALEYRAAIDSFEISEGGQSGELDDQVKMSGFLTRVRCMLKLGLTYELRKLYPNAYQMYCNLITLLTAKRWVDEQSLGLDVAEARVTGWRGKRLVLIDPMVRARTDSKEVIRYKYSPGVVPAGNAEDQYLRYRSQFGNMLIDKDDKNDKDAEYNIEYGANVDGIISSFARNLTKEKSKSINALTLFEEVRYVYQGILAKLSILEKMGMSGITQTNIDVAEGEFIILHKSVNIKENFILSADFFRKLAEILYYKNSLTILTQNQDSLYSSVYYGDYDLLVNLDDFCIHNYQSKPKSNALDIKHDVKFFFNNLNNCAASSESKLPVYVYGQKEQTLKSLFEELEEHLDDYFSTLEVNGNLIKGSIKQNVRGYIEYNRKVYGNDTEEFNFNGLGYCDHHRHLLRQHNLRPACYACKYYTRSLRIMAENMFEDKRALLHPLTKAYGVLCNSFKKCLLYTGSKQTDMLAQTLEGFGNVMFACASGDDCEGEKFKTRRGISPIVVRLLTELCSQSSEDEEMEVIRRYETDMKTIGILTRLDKSLLYYWDAYRFYLINSHYNEAVGCIGKVITVFVYYMEVLNYNKNRSDFQWADECETVQVLIGDEKLCNSLIGKLFALIVRYTGFKYDLSNYSEMNELRWIYSKELRNHLNLSQLSNYPNIRPAFLRSIEIIVKGIRYLQRHSGLRTRQDYQHFISLTYSLIAPSQRYVTTFYDEVMGYYTKVRYNDHIFNNIFKGNFMLNDRDEYNYNPIYQISFYECLAEYLNNDEYSDKLDNEDQFFRTGNDPTEKLDLIEYLVHDTMVCLTSMTQIFTPHNHLTSFSKSFVGVVYNYMWEWSRRYELVYCLYQYQERAIVREEIINSILNSMHENNTYENQRRLEDSMNRCAEVIDKLNKKTNKKPNYGMRSERMYSRLRHDIDDSTINTIFSNFTAETAINYYRMAEEMNTEGDAYHDLLDTMHFLDDDMNNDTCQFNIACERFLLNSGIVERQYCRLRNLYCNSNAYSLYHAYIKGPHDLQNSPVRQRGQFEHSPFINSEYSEYSVD